MEGLIRASAVSAKCAAACRDEFCHSKLLTKVFESKSQTVPNRKLIAAACQTILQTNSNN